MVKEMEFHLTLFSMDKTAGYEPYQQHIPVKTKLDDDLLLFTGLFVYNHDIQIAAITAVSVAVMAASN